MLTRFKEEPVAFIGDIEAILYQVRVSSEDCDALRFLWWPEGNLSEEPEEYEMRVHLFGGASSPSCANFALKKTAKDNEADFSPEVIETVERNFIYVDDWNCRHLVALSLVEWASVKLVSLYRFLYHYFGT